MKIVENVDGITLELDEGAIIRAKNFDNYFLIEANSAGLLSLAKHMTSVAQVKVKDGFHVHYEDSIFLEQGSSEFIIEKII
jgi:hypothetical protein